MKIDINNLKLSLKGFRIMSVESEILYNELLVNKIPINWQ